MASSSFEAVLSSSEMNFADNSNTSESPIRLAELGPEGIAEFNRQINQRVQAARSAEESSEESDFIDVASGEEREDVSEARRLPQRLGVELYYGDPDHLELANAKVRRREVLEADIVKQVEPLDDALRQKELQEVSVLAQSAKQIVKEIQKIGQDMDTSVVKPTEMIGSILEVFKRMCRHVTLDMKPKGSIAETLERVHNLMEERLAKLRAFDMNSAEEILKEAFKLLEKSCESASQELSAVTSLIDKVEDANHLVFFFETKEQIEDMIKGEIKELRDLKAACEGDLASAEKFEEELNEKHQRCTDFHFKQITSLDRKLEKNRREQEELRKRLRELEASERDFEEKKEVEKESQENATRCVARGVESLNEESKKIRELILKADASLKIMEKTQGLGILIFDNAVTREEEVQKALKERKMKALREDRSALMESAVANRLTGKDHEGNARDIKQEIQRLNEDMRVKAQRGMKTAVIKIQKDLEEQKASLAEETKKMTEARREYEALVEQIKEVEKGMDDDDPVLRMTVDNLYEEKKEAIAEFWDLAGTEKQMQSIPEWSLQ